MSRPVPAQDRSRKRVDAIVDSALDVLRDEGIDGFTVANIASRAGISPASLYRYFGDRSAVLQAVAERTLEGLHVALRDSMSSIRSATGARRALTEALHTYFDAVQNDRALRELWLGTLADPQLIALNIADSRRNGEMIAQRLAPWSPVPIGVLKTRAFLIAHLTGAAIALILDVDEGEAKRLSREVDRLVEFFFNR
jgi:AcrR family transcriptional regulator